MVESKYSEPRDAAGFESKFGEESKSGCGSGSSSGARKGGREGKRKNDTHTLVSNATKYCFSSEFIGVFERYIKDNAYIFHEAARTGNKEHALEFTELFEDYLKLYESTMEGWLEQEGLTLKEFNEALEEAQENGKSGEKYFIKLLIASGEYDCFYDVMYKEAQRQVAAKSGNGAAYDEDDEESFQGY